MAWKHLSVHKYPFSRRFLQPKIPDGKTLVGLGFTNKISTNVALPNNAQPTDILLFPGLGCHCVIKNAESIGTQKFQDDANNDKQPDCHTLSARDVVWWNMTETAPGSAVHVWSQLEGSEIHRWHAVSMVIKFDLTNDGEENDGHWQACHISTTTDASDHQQEAVVSTNPKAAVLYPTKAL